MKITNAPFYYLDEYEDTGEEFDADCFDDPVMLNLNHARAA